MEEGCDVYRRDLFLDGLLVLTSSEHGGHDPATEFRRHLEVLGASWLHVRSDKGLLHRLPPGPYMYIDKALKPVYRLYDDVQGSFLTALKPRLTWHDTVPYSQLRAAGTSYDCLSVAVPARFPGSVQSCAPRLRVVVKDLYRMKGLKTSLNNRAYYDFSEPADSTAAVISSLARDGAHILGMTKLSSMIAREEPLDAVDFHTAFNPRGDGYQSPAGSSSGSAAAVAAYDWVDCGIGSDTSGSGRRPALANGVWQFRPSHDRVDLRGMVVTYAQFDTPCIFARELRHLKTALRSWIPESGGGQTHADQRMPADVPSYEIVYPLDYLPVPNQEQMALIDSFLSDAASHLPATVRKISIRETWKSSHPVGTPDDVDEYLRDVVTRTYYYAFYHSSDEFRNKYAQAHDGRPPYVIPFVQRRWAKGAAVTAAQHQEATDRLKEYKEWLLRTVFYQGGQNEKEKQKQVLVLLPIGNVVPNYRDTPSPSPEEQSALDELFLPPILGAPDIAVPIGDVPYQSRITGQTEHLPVVVNFVAAPGRDWELIAAVEKIMALSARPTVVRTGKRMFEAS
ncbi:uncharacterized protein THITE_2049603 [Thermothielavioides terrestris NRRL 8126]|uniref:Amidase domain-containing protein n=1 Tax=Thermothielavioides terrestris (strain ATCC 38088 / NRRL 8126) TaxID=578455 RepID=G2R5F0_THETT|nr:uncharacterized protein THITE_2049603 [Thermothielavioides terrestris NRRL 8126]AEO67441.1 hypothetical protein THITE_2049603 [Thermothielavioides terrestris NRRL 8126]